MDYFNIITGTLVWYYYICKREVWLMSHYIVPNQADERILLGKIISENSYGREKREIRIKNLVLDIISTKNENIIVAEVKKSSRYIKSATMQVKFYIWQLKQLGIKNIIGELRIPKEKKKIEIYLTPKDEIELKKVLEDIKNIILRPQPELPREQKYCRLCGYNEFCWI
ncbi:MAG: CRISPR-associated protein Cas4 [Elusimicrobiota bacterium]|nr:CRISPR-associated protein Cas4 [Endomicrobiia bacterium]MDW8166267.1 CRISPR-associated protein Cas4 [Elusimicrobiota bacterium]